MKAGRQQPRMMQPWCDSELFTPTMHSQDQWRVESDEYELEEVLQKS